jgi:hypothetical protein
MDSYPFLPAEKLYELYSIHQGNLARLEEQIAKSSAILRNDLENQADDERVNMRTIVAELHRRDEPLPAGVPAQMQALPRQPAASAARMPIGVQSAGSPFVVGRPLQTHNSLFGRDNILRWVSDQVVKCSSVNIVGERRMGKTSLLNHLEPRLRREHSHTRHGVPIVWLRVDLQGGITNQDSFFGAIVVEVLGNAVVPDDLRNYAQQVQTNPLAMFGQCEIVLERCRDQAHPMVLIDEFEQWLEPESATSFPYPTFFNNVRSLIGKNLLTMVIASRAPLLDLFDQHPTRLTSTFPSYFPEITLGPLDAAAADALLLQSSDRPLQAFEAAEAAAWAHGHPCLLQVAGDAYYAKSAYGQTHEEMLRGRERSQRQNCSVPRGQAAIKPRRPWLLRLLLALFWDFPKRVGRLAQLLGAKFDEMAAWLIGMALIVVAGLVVANLVTGNQLWTAIRTALGIE